MNCYACHSRDGMGGPEISRNPLFKTSMKEMGDEGRLPPPLDGVGDKLQRSYLESILDAGCRRTPLYVREYAWLWNRER